MKTEIKNAILRMLSDDTSIIELCDNTEDFTWVFDYVKSNADQLHRRFQATGYQITDDYKTTFFINGLRAILTTWIDNGCAESADQMNEIVMKEYKRLFA